MERFFAVMFRVLSPFCCVSTVFSSIFSSRATPDSMNFNGNQTNINMEEPLSADVLWWNF